LLLTPVCVAVGVGTAYWQSGQLSWLQVLVVLAGALASHISVNAFNEYFDFASGLDAKTQRTPFSGGSGTLPAHPELASSTLALAITTLLIAAVIGLYFIWLRGWMLLPLGIFGLSLLVTYTIWWAYHPILCLIAPGLGFGILMVMGTHFSLTGTYVGTPLIASLLPTFLVSDLLLLNQFPDIEADKSIGRKNFPIIIGPQASARLYGILLLMAYASVVLGIMAGFLPRMCALALFTVPLAWRAYRGVSRHAANTPALLPSMRLNVIINLISPILLATGFFVG
jgi:1,4-dihydroxy-2-naphthoate polyprenyltransferase